MYTLHIFSHNRESSAPYLKLVDILNIDSIFELKISLLAHKVGDLFKFVWFAITFARAVCH